jgi:UDP-sugar transporter A1/2/3
MAPRKWRALATLFLGVVLISNEAFPKSANATAAHALALKDFLVGMFAAGGDVLLSGFASIYFEMVLKSKTETFSVWDRNIQLSFWSALM